MFGRKSGPPQDSSDATLEVPASSDPDVSAAPKGRPTPSRKEAEAARKERLKPTVDKREAARRDREARARQREQMMKGDESSLMPRDRGPVRRFTRDFVDGRRNAGELFLPGALLILMLGFVRNLTVQQASLWIWFAMVLVIAIDTGLMLRRLKAALRDRFPDEDLKGVSFYAVMRVLQIRPLRVPKCQVRPGGGTSSRR